MRNSGVVNFWKCTVTGSSHLVTCKGYSCLCRYTLCNASSPTAGCNEVEGISCKIKLHSKLDTRWNNPLLLTKLKSWMKDHPMCCKILYLCATSHPSSVSISSSNSRVCSGQCFLCPSFKSKLGFLRLLIMTKNRSKIAKVAIVLKFIQNVLLPAIVSLPFRCMSLPYWNEQYWTPQARILSELSRTDQDMKAFSHNF